MPNHHSTSQWVTYIQWGKCEVIGQKKRHWKMDSVRVKRGTKFCEKKVWESCMVETIHILGKNKKTPSLERKLENEFAKLSINGDEHEK